MDLVVYVLATATFLLASMLLALGFRFRRLNGELIVAEEWEQLCSQLDVGIGFCDEHLNLRRANPAFFGMFLSSKRRLKHRGVAMIEEWLGERGAGHPLQDMLLAALSGKEEARGSVRLDDGVTCVVRVRRVSLNSGKLLLTVVAARLRDRAEAGELTMVPGGADAARTQDERRGERRKREQKKNESILRIAHDLRNPLNAAMGWLHLIETDKVPREELGSAVRRIHNNILRQNGLIDELRHLADPLPPVKQPKASERSMGR